MRVILLGDAVKYPPTGIGRYIVRLFEQFQKEGFDIALWKNGLLEKVDFNELANPSSKPTWQGSLIAFLRRFPWVAFWLSEVRQFLRNRLFKRSVAGALVHGPSYELHDHNGPRVVTIHDLSVFSWAHCHPPDRVLRMQHVIEQSIKKAHRILTDSEFNRAELLQHFSISPERVVAVPLACDERFSPQARLQDGLSGLPSGQYGLFIGTIEPRKNLEILLRAWRDLPRELRQKHPLVVAGSHGWQSAGLHEQMERAASEGWLKYLGYVADTDLPSLYAHAAVFCFPSWYEGFGLPVLEAMSTGVPVICSDAACMPEVGGDAVYYAKPDDQGAWTSAIEMMLTQLEVAKAFSEAGTVRAKQFSWSRTAAETRAVYAQAQAEFAKESQV